MSDLQRALAEALEAAPDWLRRQLWSRTADHVEAASILCESEPMEEWLRQFAKDCGAAGYAEGLHDAETDPDDCPAEALLAGAAGVMASDDDGYCRECRRMVYEFDERTGYPTEGRDRLEFHDSLCRTRDWLARYAAHDRRVKGGE